MLEVTRLNGTSFFLNPDTIATVEASPDTVVTLINGEKLLVKESPQVLVERFLDFKRHIRLESNLASQG